VQSLRLVRQLFSFVCSTLANKKINKGIEQEARKNAGKELCIIVNSKIYKDLQKLAKSWENL
jgi:hypothetical protein